MEPSEMTVSAFNAFADANNLTATVISPNNDWVSITLPISQANSLFAAQFQTFTHPLLTAPITRSLTVSLPSDLVAHVDVLHPTTDFTGPNTRLGPLKFTELATAAVSASCDTIVSTGVITPACLQVSLSDYQRFYCLTYMFGGPVWHPSNAGQGEE